MIETELQLLKSYSVTIDALSTGWINDVGPTQSSERWEIDSIQTVCTSVAQSRLFVFRQGRNRLVEGTYSGNLDTSNTNIRLQPGERLNFNYTQADVASIGTITITGRQFLQGRRAY